LKTCTAQKKQERHNGQEIEAGSFAGSAGSIGQREHVRTLRSRHRCFSAGLHLCDLLVCSEFDMRVECVEQRNVGVNLVAAHEVALANKAEVQPHQQGKDYSSCPEGSHANSIREG